MAPALTRVALTGGIAAVAVVGAAHVWARHVEIHQYRLRRIEVAALPTGSRPLRLLHISDIHLLPEQHRKLAFLRELASLEVDLVVDTGDNIASADAVAPVATALRPLLRRPGAFVMGSNDMFAPTPKNPLRYFLPDPRPAGFVDRTRERSLPTDLLAQRLSEHGWRDLTNRRDVTDLPGLRVEWTGVDDPHLERDELPGESPGRSTGPAEATGSMPTIRIGVAHAPYRRVLDGFVADGCDLILAGHTHGGQLRVPGVGALVTNCDLPRSQAKGLSDWMGVPLHVSGGMGASPYANMRFANPPEATLLTVGPRRT